MKRIVATILVACGVLLPMVQGGVRRLVTSVSLVGEFSIPTGFTFKETEVGGISGISYDSRNDIYYALSDDRVEPRFYTLRFSSLGSPFTVQALEFLDVVQLVDQQGVAFPPGELDTEGIAYSPDSETLFISSEGDANQGIDPFVGEFTTNGMMIREFSLSDYYLPTEDGGIRNNLALEPLTLTPDGSTIWTATENALKQDGPASTVDGEGLARMIAFDVETGDPIKEAIYIVNPIPDAPIPPESFAVNGFVDLVALDDDGSFLVMERSFSNGVGNDVRLYNVLAQGALDTLGVPALCCYTGEDGSEDPIPFEIAPPVQKFSLANFEDDLGVIPDNLEALELIMDDDGEGGYLLVVSDNNFSDTQKTQFVSLRVTFETIPLAHPALETPNTADDEDLAVELGFSLAGDSDDPAIWLHPEDSSKSRVICTLKDGGLVVFDLGGKIVQKYLPAPFGEIRYNNVDVAYGFRLDDGSLIDIAVASDRQNDSLAIWEINKTNGRLTEITSPSILETIFGVDDGEATAYGLSLYTSPIDHSTYAYVTQAAGNLVAQLRIFDDGDGKVFARLERMIDLPIPEGGEAGDSQSEGIVVDLMLGLLYVSLEDEIGILRYDAEPDGGNDYTLVASIDEPFLVPDIEGLTIYYTSDGGYLIASSQGASTFAVFDRLGDNAYLGSFAIGANGDVDQTSESDGLTVLNVPLGPKFPLGLLISQDGANDPQVVVQDDEALQNIGTNFKYIPWESVAEPLGLVIDTEFFDPRNPCPNRIGSFSLIDASENAPQVDLGILPPAIDYDDLPSTALNIRANEVCNLATGSVRVEFDGKKSCQKFTPYAVFGDDSDEDLGPIGPFSAETIALGRHRVKATPFAGPSCNGASGQTLSKTLNVLYRGAAKCPGAVVGFNLYDADMDKMLQPLNDGAEFCYSDKKLSIEAVVVDCIGQHVRCVLFRLRGGFNAGRKENEPKFFLFGDVPGDIKGRRFKEGTYEVKATPYPQREAGGSAGTTNTINFKVRCKSARRLRHNDSDQ